MLDFLKTFFKHNPLDIIMTKTYTYKTINNYTDISFLHKDIIEYNKALETILNLDLLNTYIDKHSLLNTTPVKTTIKHWCTDNNRMLNDLNTDIYKWVKYSKELNMVYTKLNNIRKSGTHVSFNIRIIKPYIINIEDITDILN